MTLTIRPATPADIPAITRIYAQAVDYGTASFELMPPNEAEMTRRMNELLARNFPYLAHWPAMPTPRPTARGPRTVSPSKIPSTWRPTCTGAAWAKPCWKR